MNVKAMGIAACVAAVALGAASFAVATGVMAQSEAAKTEKSDSNVVIVPTFWEEDAEAKGAVKPSNIEGLSACGLTAEETEKLCSYLTDRLHKGQSMSDAKFKIAPAETADEGYRAFDLDWIDEGRAYTLYVGEVWTLESREEGSKSSSSASAGAQGRKASPEAAPATQAPEDVAAQDQHGKLHSTQTSFDERRAWPLSKREKVEPIIGADVAGVLLADINEYIAPAGGAVTGEANVLVSEDGVTATDALVEFSCMAYVGNDRAVLACSYDPKTLAHAIVLQP